MVDQRSPDEHGHAPQILVRDALSGEETEGVLALVEAAAAADGFSALNEAALLHLRHDRSGVRHLLLREGGRLDGALTGYAQLDEQVGASSVGQLAVAPERRRAGVGSALLAALLRLSSARLEIWAMGNTEAARRLATRHGLVVARELLVMTRTLAEPVPRAPVPAGIELRTFSVGQDEAAWLRVNARAFRDHPEQGQLDRADLADRMAEPWFDPAGFFLAVRGSSLVGFHWTKEHEGGVGEVYVLGVDPEAGGRGLGKALLSRGLEHLRTRGLGSVKLYVEADHASAVGLYAGYGFAVAGRDVMYAQP